MDILELKRRYESLSDDEIMRICADKCGLSDIAASVLAEEITKRKLNDAQAQARVSELGQELAENRLRFERGQRRIVRRVLLVAIAAVASVLMWFFSTPR